MSTVDDVVNNLSRQPRSLIEFSWIPWDTNGSSSYELAAEQDSYYYRRDERRIFEQRIDEIIAQVIVDNCHYRRLRVVDLGSGKASNTMILLAALRKIQTGPIHYLPVDISTSPLGEVEQILDGTVKDVTVSKLVKNYVTESLDLPSYQGCTLVAYIGGSICNFSREKATEILRKIREQLVPGDGILIGFDMNKNPVTLTSAYDDATGHFAALFLNA